jgi:hypothetical protein
LRIVMVSRAVFCIRSWRTKGIRYGQKPTFAPQKAMSALPPKADMCSAPAYVCFGPKADTALYFVARRDAPKTTIATSATRNRISIEPSPPSGEMFK